MKPLRIWVVEPDAAGGLIHYAYQLCGALADAGAEVTLVTGADYELAGLPHRFALRAEMKLWPPIEDEPPPPSAALRAGRSVARRLRRARRAVRLAAAWERLTRRVLAERPDAVLIGNIRFPFQALWTARMDRRGVPLLQICHEFEPRESRLRPVAALNRRWSRALYTTFGVIFLHGEANRSRFREIYPHVPAERLRLIPHGDESMFLDEDAGGDLAARYGLPGDRPVALFFGGIRPSKGVTDLIEAFAMARRETEAILLVVGHPTGVDPEDLRRRARDHGIAADVIVDDHYLPMKEVGPLMRTATVLVLPYRSATASGALQVAYTFERPVIATSTGGLPDAVVDGETGLLVPPADPPALARALVKMLGDPAEAALMGRQGRELAETRFGWRAIAAVVLEACREAAGKELR
jgi:glycosyltransferase involved in cell wall biosynthesis